MKVVFVSNYFNHHQKPLSDCMNKMTEYTFMQTEEMEEDRKNLGWGEDRPCYLQENYSGSYKDMNPDVVIVGSAPEVMVQQIIKTNRLVFRYSERPFKQKQNPMKFFPRVITWNRRNPMTKPLYMLCASAYTALDYSKFGLFRNRTYKWGYFPQHIVYDTDKLMAEKNTTEILWCGRFLPLKHADDVILIADKLKKSGYNFNLKFIGTGEMEQQLKSMVCQLDLEDSVQFLGSMRPEQVRTHMEKAGIYLFTSDKQEGWGAVLNESMNSGCAVVASHLIGSVPFLLENNKNGLIYQSGNVEMLYEKVKFLLDNPGKQKEFGKAAYETIIKEWNAEVAAQRFVNLAQHILDGEKQPDLYKSGPCSKAEILKEDWLKEIN